MMELDSNSVIITMDSGGQSKTNFTSKKSSYVLVYIITVLSALIPTGFFLSEGVKHQRHCLP